MKILRYILTLFIALVFSLNSNAQADRQYIRNGNKFYRQQNYAKAEVEYRKAISVNGQNTQAIYNLGCAMMMQKQDSVAITFFQKAGQLERTPKRKAKAFHNIGVICQQHQMYGDAIEAYKESLRNNPDDEETRYNLALCKHLLKKQPKDNKKDKNEKEDKNKKDKNEDKQDKDKQEKERKDPKEQKPKEHMSRENAEQLLNAAMQSEKATQQRLKKNLRQPRNRKILKNW